MNNKIGGSNPDWHLVTAVNVDGLLIAVSDFEHLFQVCTCSGFSLDHLAVISENPQNRFIRFNVIAHFRMDEM
jgi:hypothetical protein